MSKILKSLYHHRLLLFGVIDQAVVSGSNFACNILIARSLGARGFGEFSLAWMTILVFCALQDALIVHPMLSIGPKQPPEERPAYLGAVIVQCLIFAGATFCLIVGLMSGAARFWADSRFQELSLPVAVAAVGYLMQNCARYAFFAYDRPRAAFACDAISYLGKFLVVVYLASKMCLDVKPALVAVALTSGLAVAVSGFMLGKIQWDPRVLASVTARHWGFGRWLAATALIRWADADWYTWIAGGVLGVSAVGTLKAAQNVTNVLQLFFAGLESVVTPQAARLFHQGGRPALIRYMGSVGRPIGLATTVVVFGIALAPDACLRLFYGSSFPSSAMLMRWLALTQLLVFMLFEANVIARTLESTRLLLVASGAAVVFNMTSSHLLLGGLSLEGAGIGLLLGRAVSLSVLVYALLPRKRSFAPEISGEPA